MTKKITISYSRAETWKECPYKDWLKYDQHVRPLEEGASLFFGGCIDNALGFLLNCKKEGKEDIGLTSFKELFLVDKDRGWNNAFDSSKHRYSRADYDDDVLWLADDKALLKKWEEELKVKTFDVLKDEKQKKYKVFSGNKLTFFNRICWLSLKRKGQLMLDAFAKEILPKIKKVIAVQHAIVGEIGDIAEAKGYIDLICEYEGYDKPIIFDIKTSGMVYEDDSIHFSHQLQTYLAVVGPDLETDFAGYIVLLKFMKKKEVCSSCGGIKTTRHRTCNAETATKGRCNGKWSTIPEGHTQVQVKEISKEVQAEALQGLANIAVTINNGLIWKDLGSCKGKYGLCDMFFLCHYKDRSRYRIPEKSEINKLLPVINNEETK